MSDYAELVTKIQDFLQSGEPKVTPAIIQYVSAMLQRMIPSLGREPLKIREWNYFSSAQSWIQQRLNTKQVETRHVLLPALRLIQAAVQAPAQLTFARSETEKVPSSVHTVTEPLVDGVSNPLANEATLAKKVATLPSTETVHLWRCAAPGWLLKETDRGIGLKNLWTLVVTDDNGDNEILFQSCDLKERLTEIVLGKVQF